MKNNRFKLIGSLLSLLILILLGWGCQKKNEEIQKDLRVPVQVIPVFQEEMAQPLHTYGRLSSQKEMKLSFKIGGIIESIFADETEATFAYQTDKIELRQPIKVRINGKIVETTIGRVMFNQILPKELGFINQEIQGKTLEELTTRALRVCDRKRVVQLIDDFKKMGFWAMTVSGLSVGVWDCELYPDKDKFLQALTQDN